MVRFGDREGEMNNMKKLSAVIVLAACGFGLAGSAGASGDSLALALRQIQADTEQNIQSKIVDPILGKGNAFAFVEMSMEVVLKENAQTKEGVGWLNKRVSTETAPSATAGTEAKDEDLFKGVEQPAAPVKAAPADKKQKADDPGKAARTALPQKIEQSQTAQQEKRDVEERTGAELVINNFSLRILHDSGVSREKLEILSKAVLALYPKVIKGQADMLIVFVPAPFAKEAGTWMEKLAK